MSLFLWKSPQPPQLTLFPSVRESGKRNRGTVDFSFVIVPPFLLSFVSFLKVIFAIFRTISILLYAIIQQNRNLLTDQVVGQII